MRIYTTKRLTLLLAAGLLWSATAQAKVSVGHLTVEHRAKPFGLDEKHPRLGWQIESDKNNVAQRTYRVIIASTRSKAESLEGDEWDSGTVKSNQSQWVDVPIAMSPNKQYFWRVLVDTNKGKSQWSEIGTWTTGLLDDANWEGEWIGMDSMMVWDCVGRHSRLSARYLRKEFAVRKEAVKRATIHISGVGLYTLNINGQRVGNDVLTPLPTDYTKTIAYDTYDITSLMANDNAIGATLEGGHYFAQTQNYQTNVRTTYGQPRLRANIIIEYTDGRQESIVTDSTWRVTADGPVRYANEYDGELYNSNITIDGWDKPGYDDSRWGKADVMKAPGGKLVGSPAPNMSIYQTERPVTIRRFGLRHIIDFGTNNAGRIRLHLSQSAKGDTIRIRHAELLEQGDSTLYVKNLRHARATAFYVANGETVDWAPEFTFYGFRYAEVTGVSDLDKEQITRELIADRMDDSHTDFAVVDRNGSDMLNRIVDNARRGVRSNYKGMPIDCPQRDERMPWLGDRTTGCLGESFLMDNHALYAKWVKDICDGQRADGRISDVTPAYWRLYNTNITWPAALPFACDMLYRQYGDLRPMAESYEAIKKWLEMIRKENYKDGLVPYDRYGDWCVPPESPNLVHSKDPARKTDGQLISSAYYHYLCRMMARYARLLEHDADASHFEAESNITLNAVNATYLKDGNYSNATVTANLMPLTMGMVPKEMEQTVHDNLLSTIVEKNGTHVSSGVIGIQWLMRYLSETGSPEVAYCMATTDTYPGWGYMVKRGATTIWELWNGDTADPSMNSGNHVMLLGDLLPWCYENIGGIKSGAPGFSHIIMAPDFSNTLINGAKASHLSPYGAISSQWQRDGKGITWNVEIPANTTAELHTTKGVKQVKSGKHTIRF